MAEFTIYVQTAHIIMINWHTWIYAELKYLVFSARYSLVNAKNETYNKIKDEKQRALKANLKARR